MFKSSRLSCYQPFHLVKEFYSTGDILVERESIMSIISIWAFIEFVCADGDRSKSNKLCKYSREMYNWILIQFHLDFLVVWSTAVHQLQVHYTFKIVLIDFKHIMQWVFATFWIFWRTIFIPVVYMNYIL